MTPASTVRLVDCGTKIPNTVVDVEAGDERKRGLIGHALRAIWTALRLACVWTCLVPCLIMHPASSKSAQPQSREPAEGRDPET